MFIGRILQLLRRQPSKVVDPANEAVISDLNRGFSASQNCDVKVSAARSADLDMVPPNLR